MFADSFEPKKFCALWDLHTLRDLQSWPRTPEMKFQNGEIAFYRSYGDDLWLKLKLIENLIKMSQKFLNHAVGNWTRRLNIEITSKMTKNDSPGIFIRLIIISLIKPSLNGIHNWLQELSFTVKKDFFAIIKILIDSRPCHMGQLWSPAVRAPDCLFCTICSWT